MPEVAVPVTRSCLCSGMTKILLRGIQLRYALTLYLGQHGPQTVPELVAALDYQGFSFAGRPSKAVSDALRWEVRHGRVLHMRRGRYAPGDIPRSTEYRIHDRVMRLRREARRVGSLDEDCRLEGR